jgi:hypothetical protein
MTSTLDATRDLNHLPTGAIARDAALGAAAGIGATLAMSVVMLTAQRLGLLGEQPPRKLSDRLHDAVGNERAGEGERRLGTAAIHLGIGAIAAAGQQVVRRGTRWPQPAGLWGAAFGGAFWAVNYGLVAPALNIMPPPWSDRPGRAPVMLAANVLYGALAAGIGDALVRRAARLGPSSR